MPYRFQDEAYMIYVNSGRQDNTELGRLMHDLHCKNAEDMHSEVLAKRVYELKETQEGVDLCVVKWTRFIMKGQNAEKLKDLQKESLQEN